MAIGDFLQILGQGISNYGQYQYQRKRADQDDAFTQQRIKQAEDELREREQRDLRGDAQTNADREADALERAGIYGARPGLAAIAGTQGNRVQGQDSAAGDMRSSTQSALQALAEASQGGNIPDDQVTELGNGRYFVPPNIGKPQKPVMGSEEWLSALSALAHSKADEQIRVNAAKPVSPTAATTQANQNEKFLQADVDRYIAEAGGDPNQAMTRYFQQRGMGSAQSPEEAQQLSDLSTRFNAAGQKFSAGQTTTTQSPTGRSVTVRGNGKIPWSAVPRAERRQIAQSAGINPSNDPQTIASMKAWLRSNRPDIDPDR